MLEVNKAFVTTFPLPAARRSEEAKLIGGDEPGIDRTLGGFCPGLEA
jgi:hypothetical protein